MNQLEFNRAMSYIDDDIVECFLNKKSKLENKIKFQKKSHSYLKWGAVAAVFCIVFSVAFVIAKQANDNPNLPEPGIDQIIGNITEDTTANMGEATTEGGEATTQGSEEITTDTVINHLGLPAPIDEIVWSNDSDSSSESFGMYWNGLLLVDELYKAINKACEDKYFAMYFFYYGKDDVDTNAFLIDLFKEHCLVEKNGTIYVFATKSEIANFDANALKDYQICFAEKSIFVDVPPPTFSPDIFVTDVVMGFDLNKIKFNATSPSSDQEVTDMLNIEIESYKYTYDSLVFILYCNADVSDRDFTSMNYYDLYIDEYLSKHPAIIIQVKYEDINMEALRDISNMDEISIIRVSHPYTAVPE